MNAPHALQRETFELSRAMEFFTEKELVAQIGFSRDMWPIALLKELLDNALDACERADLAPVISAELSEDVLIVADNGPGLPLETLKRSMDYQVRISDKTGYVSPSRGQQGNALKTLWAAPFVATGESLIEVATAEYCCEVRVTLDRIAQEPRLVMEFGDSDVKTGTRITVRWNRRASYLENSIRHYFYRTAFSANDLNPHCEIQVKYGEVDKAFPATQPSWRRWRTDQPTSPHWYGDDQFRALIALLIGVENRGGKARSVNEFIREFHGLSGTAKAKEIAGTTGLTGAMLHDLVLDGDVDRTRLTALLAAMKAAARPVKPDALGVLGETHVANVLGQYGAEPESCQYRIAKGTTDSGLPYVLEVGFGVRGYDHRRLLIVGINHSPALRQPFSELDDALSSAASDADDPIILLVHLTCPHISYSDRGKTRAILPDAIAADLARLVKTATADFTKAKRRADRNGRLQARDMEELRTRNREKKMSAKEASWKVMKQAYLKASANNTLPANARQIMYAARPLVIGLTGKTSPWKNTATFTQHYLPDYINEHPECENWDVVFDDRGHFEEPHTGHKIGVGTLAVRNYLRQWTSGVGKSSQSDTGLRSSTLDTAGPSLRYRFVLFVEKEGFNPLLERARIAERYDLAILSTKGVSVTAARTLVEKLSEEGVTTLVLRDFDKSGFIILHTLRTDTRRYQFKTPPDVIDLGLSLRDVQDLNLEAEEVDYGDVDPRPSLRECGATPDEVKFLVADEKRDGRIAGQRVELNAMDSQQFIDWLESKLKEHKVGKFIPEDEETLKKAWQRAWRIGEINKAIAKAVEGIPEPPAPPADLAKKIAEKLKSNPDSAWDDVLAGFDVGLFETA